MQYPTLRLGVLQALADLKAALDADEGFLKARACPYDPEVVALLEKLFEPKVIEKIVLKDGAGKVLAARGRGRPKKEGQVSVELEFEIEDLIEEMKGLKVDGASMDVSDKVAIVRAKTGLLEKAVGLRERWTGVKRVNAFFGAVIGILDDLCPEDVRVEVQKRLEPFREAV